MKKNAKQLEKWNKTAKAKKAIGFFVTYIENDFQKKLRPLFIKPHQDVENTALALRRQGKYHIVDTVII